MTESPRVLVAGETLIDFLPEEPGSLSSVETFRRRAGGAPANVAVALTRLGETSWFWTRIGADAFGDFLATTLESYGIPDRFVARDQDAQTSLAFVAHGSGGDPMFSFYRDRTADTRMQPGTITDEVLDSVEWVHVGGVTLTDDPSRSATIDLATRARDRGCTVSFDPNARPELWTNRGEFRTAVEDLFALSDVVKATPGDLSEAGFSDEAPEALAKAICDRGPHTALLTLGEAGSIAHATAESPWSGSASHPGYAVEPIDATGAGDAFLAGAIASLLEESALAEALAEANAVAAVSTTAAGAMAALPDREEVREFRAGAVTTERDIR